MKSGKNTTVKVAEGLVYDSTDVAEFVERLKKSKERNMK